MYSRWTRYFDRVGFMSETGDHFGSSLRDARENRALSLGDIAASTKVPRGSLELIESGDLEGLPADVFVRGFIRSYAKAVGINEVQPLSQFDRALRARSEAARAQSALPVVDPKIAGLASVPANETDTEDQSTDQSTRRGLGLAVFVIILLLIATITLSLLLRRPPPSGEGLSDARPVPALPAAPSDVGVV
jgi:cytoskeletal protein RodZ